jgi:hypothetical protein
LTRPARPSERSLRRAAAGSHFSELRFPELLMVRQPPPKRTIMFSHASMTSSSPINPLRPAPAATSNPERRRAPHAACARTDDALTTADRQRPRRNRRGNLRRALRSRKDCEIFRDVPREFGSFETGGLCDLASMYRRVSPIDLVVEEGLLFYSKRAGDFCFP